MAGRITLIFVDHEYVLTDAASGTVVLDVNDGISYEFMLDTWLPKPAPQRQSTSDSPLVDGKQYRPGLDKIEMVTLPFSIKVIASDPDDRRAKATALMDAARNHKLHVVYSPEDSTTLTFYDIIPTPDFNTERYWTLGMELNDLAVIDFEIEASTGYGTKRYLYPLRNLAPNPSFENWSGTVIVDWASTPGTGGAITQENAIKHHGNASVKMQRGTGNCYITSIPVAVEELRHHNIDVRVRSAAAVSVTVTLEAFDSTPTSLGTFVYAGNTRGASVFDRHCACLYAAGTTSTPGIALLPVTAATVTIKIALNTNTTTIYVDACSLVDAEYVSDNVAEGVFGLTIPEGVVEGDLPAYAEFLIGNPFTPPMWRPEAACPAYGVHALDSTHVYLAGDATATHYIYFYNGFYWAAQDGGVSAVYRDVHAKDATHVWAVGGDGIIRFSADSATWGGQTYPACAELTVDGGLEDWHDVYTLHQWTFTSPAGAMQQTRSTSFVHGGTYSARVLAAVSGFYGGRDISNAYIAINPNRTYNCSVWARGYPVDRTTLTYSVSFYNAASTYLGYKTVISQLMFDSATTVQHTATLNPADIPATATKCLLQIDGTGNVPGGYGYYYIDDISFKEDLTSITLNGVHAIATNNIIAVGTGGHIIKSANGTTWAEKTSGVTVDLNAISAVDASNIYAVGDGGTILFSADGETWTPQAVGLTTANLYGVFALDAAHIYAVGSLGSILFSNGTTWTVWSTYTGRDFRVSTPLYGVWAADSTHIWVVGDNGAILFSDSTMWMVQASGTNADLFCVSGLNATNIWIATAGTSMLKGISTAEPLPITDLIIGQRDENYHADYNPALNAPVAAGSLAYNIYRRGNQYRVVDAGTLALFLYNLLAHAGNFYAVSVGISFSATTPNDTGTLRKKLATVDGVDITSQHQDDPNVVDLGDPNTKFKETLLLASTWNDAYVASHIVSWEAILSNIDQVMGLLANASLAAVKLWVDHMAIVPTDRWLWVQTIASNYLIINSEQGEVFDSQDSGPSTAMTHDPTKVQGTPRFQLNPAGTNMTVIGNYTSAGDDQLARFDMTITYRPRTKLHL